MATAKQIAARKRFAEMARSGKLATMRKRAAKKNPAAKKTSASSLASVKRIYKKLRDDGYTAQKARERAMYEYDMLDSDDVSQAVSQAEASYNKKISKYVSTAKKNPAPKKKVQTKRGGCNPDYLVQIKKGGRWITVGSHGAQVAAEEAAVALNKAGLTAPIRVWG